MAERLQMFVFPRKIVVKNYLPFVYLLSTVIIFEIVLQFFFYIFIFICRNKLIFLNFVEFNMTVINLLNTKFQLNFFDFKSFFFNLKSKEFYLFKL